MTDQLAEQKHEDPGSSAGTSSDLFRSPSRIALGVMWLLAAGFVVVMLLQDVRLTDHYGGARLLLHVGYVGALLWFLCRTEPDLDRLPAVRQQLLPRWSFAAWIPAALIGLVFLLTIVSDDGTDILMLLMMGSTLWLLVVWWRQIRLVPVAQGLVLAVVAGVAILPAMSAGFISETALYLLAGMTAPMFVVGGMLFRRSGLGGVRLLEGSYAGALRSFLLGCLMFLPLGLINAADGSPGGDTSWVNQVWMPFTLPWFSGIAEETWFRLLLVGLVYFLLRPAFRDQPAVAVVLAVFFSGITFGLGHGRTVERFLTTGLLYGVPMAAVFAKRDFEHAVGAHYMVNMIPWAMAYLES